MRQYGSFNPGSGMGGSAVHWSGMLWRFLETDFNYRSHVIERYGKDKIPEGSLIQDWPVNYAELEPYYDQMEYDIGASGQAGNLNGSRSTGATYSKPHAAVPIPSHPSRHHPVHDVAKACREWAIILSPNPRGSPHRLTRTGLETSAAVAYTAVFAPATAAR